MKYPFANEPGTDFSQIENVQAFRAGLDAVRGQLGRTYPLYIGGEQVYTDETIASIKPDQPGRDHRPGQQGHAGFSGQGGGSCRARVRALAPRALR